MLSHGLQKSFCWWALAAACGILLAIFTSAAEILIVGEHWSAREFRVAVYYLAWNVPLMIVSVLWLRRLYRLYPARWTGRWQVSLADILIIVFLFGLTLTGIQSLFPRPFLRVGIPVAFYFWMGWLVALLFVSRFGKSRGLDRWLDAFYYLLLAITTMFSGAVVDLIVFGFPREMIWPRSF